MSGPKIRCGTSVVIGQHDPAEWIVDGVPRCTFCVGVMREDQPGLIAEPFFPVFAAPTSPSEPAAKIKLEQVVTFDNGDLGGTLHVGTARATIYRMAPDAWNALRAALSVSVEPVPSTPRAETLAQRFHEAYEQLAPSFGYETREASAKPWADVPEQNRALMVAVCAELLGELPTPTPTVPGSTERPEGLSAEILDLRGHEITKRHDGTVIRYVLTGVTIPPGTVVGGFDFDPETGAVGWSQVTAGKPPVADVAPVWAGPGCCRAAYESDGHAHDHPPRVWAMPPEPGPEVTRVRDVYGQGFTRCEAYDGENPPEPCWIGDAFLDDLVVPDLMLSWKTLMANHAPLVEVEETNDGRQ